MTKTNRRKLSAPQWHLHASALGLSAVVFAAGCAIEDAGPGPEERVGEEAAALTQGAAGNAAATTQQEITIASLPDATCTLTDDDTGDSMSVLADDEGLVHLWAAPKAASKTFTLDCDEPNGSAGSQRVRHNFDLAQTRTFVRTQPRAQSKRRRVLPGLADPTGMSQSDVAAAGYPPRPDRDSPRYERWLELVSNPVTLIDTHAVETNQHRGPATAKTSVNWAGIALDYPGSAPYTTYTDVAAWMVVPTLSQEGSAGSMASPWVGLGGVHGDNVIIQQGIDAISTGGVTTYYAWYEYYPDGQLMLDTNVSPNDLVYMEAYECDYNYNYGPSYHGYGCFYWWNYSTGTMYSPNYKKPTGATFKGNSCEMIIERPNQCNGYCNLSSWPGLIQGTFDCYDLGKTTTSNISTDPYQKITMKNSSGQTMVTPSASNPNQVGLDWLRKK